MLVVDPPDTENEDFFFRRNIAFHAKEFHAVYIKTTEDVIKLGDNNVFLTFCLIYFHNTFRNN